MFIYTMRASSLKFFGVTTLAVIALVTLLFFIPSGVPASASTPSTSSLETVETIRFDKIKTNTDRTDFLRQFGWETETDPVEEADVTVPAEFDKVYRSYNELQKKQGFDLTKYLKRNVTRYSYRITNYPDYEGDVLANVLIYKNRVIGGDICSTDANGFIHGFDRNIEY